MMQKRNEKEKEEREKRGEKILRNFLFYIPNSEGQKSIRTALSEKPEMHANEIHELYDRHHKVSPNLNSH